MKPVAIYYDPMVPGDNCLVLCETQDKNGYPHITNHRSSCAEVGVVYLCKRQVIMVDW